MKKISIILAALMLIVAFSGCNSNNNDEKATPTPLDTVVESMEPTPTTAEGETPAPTELSPDIRERKYNGMTFQNNENYPTSEENDTLTITYNGRRAFISMTSTDLSALKEKDIAQLLSTSVTEYLKVYDVKESETDDYNGKVGGKDAKIVKSKIFVSDEDYDMTSIVVINDDNICYYISFITQSGQEADQTDDFERDFERLIESIKF